MEKIPFGDKSFDLVFLGHALHEADDISTALAEALRVARRRVVVLEWPYIGQDQGPPLAHRLRPDKVIACAKNTGFANVENAHLKHMELFLLDC
jgi:ubiquinone/menaquinone biosynthesis C-methylase UbiE